MTAELDSTFPQPWGNCEAILVAIYGMGNDGKRWLNAGQLGNFEAIVGHDGHWQVVMVDNYGECLVNG